MTILKYTLFLSACIAAGTQTFGQSKSFEDTSAILLNDVVVTGQYTPRPQINSVYKIKTITTDHIKSRGATDIAGVLNSELGMQFNTDNALGETDAKILGLGGNRLKILVDGVPITDRDATRQILTQIDINSIERIEVVEGPMSVVYGTDALAGIINIITKSTVRNESGLIVNARVQEESASNHYSLFQKDGVHNETLNLNWSNKKFGAGAYVTRNDFGGYRDTASFPAKVFKPKDQTLSGATFGYRSQKLNVAYRLDYVHENLFSANPVNINNYISFQQHFITNRYTQQIQSSWNISNKLKLNSALSFQNYKRNTESFRKDYFNDTYTPDSTNSGNFDVTKFHTWFFRTSAPWVISKIVSMEPGVELKYDKASGERIKGTPSITDYSFFISSEITPVSFINIRPGIRFSKNSEYDAPPLIPSLNTKIRINRSLQIRASYARGFRAPILRELYFNFFDANHSIEGNPNLKAETSNSYMLSLSHTGVSKSGFYLKGSVSGFYNDYSHFIDLYSFKDAYGNDIYSYFNRDNYKTVGGSVEFSAASKQLHLDFGGTYIGYYNQYQENQTLKGNRSKFSWSPEISVNAIYKIEKLKASAGLFYKYTGSVPNYIQSDNNEIILTKREAFNWADFTLSKQLFKYLTVQGGVKNIFNVTRLVDSESGHGVSNSATSINYSYGRSYFLALNFQMNVLKSKTSTSKK